MKRWSLTYYIVPPNHCEKSIREQRIKILVIYVPWSLCWEWAAYLEFCWGIDFSLNHLLSSRWTKSFKNLTTNQLCALNFTRVQISRQSTLNLSSSEFISNKLIRYNLKASSFQFTAKSFWSSNKQRIILVPKCYRELKGQECVLSFQPDLFKAKRERERRRTPAFQKFFSTANKWLDHFGLVGIKNVPTLDF